MSFKLAGFVLICFVTACGSYEDSETAGMGTLSLRGTGWKLLASRCVTKDKSTNLAEDIRFRKNITFGSNVYKLEYQMGIKENKSTCGSFEVHGDYKQNSKGIIFTPKLDTGMNKSTEICGLKPMHKMETDEPSLVITHRHEMFISYPPAKRETCAEGTIQEFYEKTGLKFDTNLEVCVGETYDIMGNLIQLAGPTYKFDFAGRAYTSPYEDSRKDNSNIKFSNEEVLSTWNQAETGLPMKRVKRDLILKVSGSAQVWGGKVFCTVKHQL